MSTEIAALIEQHQVAFALHTSILSKPLVDETAQRTADAEAHKLLLELFAAPVRTSEDVSRKAAYLLDYARNGLSDYFQEEEHIQALLESYRGFSINADTSRSVDANSLDQTAASDPFLNAIKRFNIEVAAYNAGDIADNDRDSAIYGAIHDRFFSESDGMPPPITSATGALAALDVVLSYNAFIDGEAEAVARHLRTYFEGRASS